MGERIRGLGKRGKCMAMESLIGLMGGNMWGSIGLIERKGEDCLLGLMGKVMKVLGKKGGRMEMGLFQDLIKSRGEGLGRRGRGFRGFLRRQIKIDWICVLKFIGICLFLRVFIDYAILVFCFISDLLESLEF